MRTVQGHMHGTWHVHVEWSCDAGNVESKAKKNRQEESVSQSVQRSFDS